MGTTTPNIGLNKPTIGGDSGGNAGTDAGGWPTQLNENFDLLDQAIGELQTNAYVLPENVCVVLFRDVDPYVYAGTSRTTVGTYGLESASMLRSIRIDILGVASGQGSGRYLDVYLTLGGQDIFAARLPMDQDDTGLLEVPVVASLHIIPASNTFPVVLGYIGVGAPGSNPDGATIGSAYGAVSPFTPIANKQNTVDLTIDQNLTVDVQGNNASIAFTKFAVKVIRE